MRTLKSMLYMLAGFLFTTFMIAVTYVTIGFWVRLLRALWVY
jgi:uncharacterized membrane protein